MQNMRVIASDSVGRRESTFTQVLRNKGENTLVRMAAGKWRWEAAFGKQRQAADATFSQQPKQVLEVRWLPPDPNDRSTLTSPTVVRRGLVPLLMKARSSSSVQFANSLGWPTSWRSMNMPCCLPSNSSARLATLSSSDSRRPGLRPQAPPATSLPALSNTRKPSGARAQQIGPR
jgi:hypothetical protein